MKSGLDTHAGFDQEGIQLSDPDPYHSRKKPQAPTCRSAFLLTGSAQLASLLIFHEALKVWVISPLLGREESARWVSFATWGRTLGHLQLCTVAACTAEVASSAQFTRGTASIILMPMQSPNKALLKVELKTGMTKSVESHAPSL